MQSQEIGADLISALGNRERQQYIKPEDHTDSDIEDVMEDVCVLQCLFHLYYVLLTLESA